MVPFIFIYNQFSAAALIGVSIHSNYAPSSLALNDSSHTFTTIFQPLLNYASAQGFSKHPTASVLQTSPHLPSFMNSSKLPWFIQKTTYVAALATTAHLARVSMLLFSVPIWTQTHTAQKTQPQKKWQTLIEVNSKKRDEVLWKSLQTLTVSDFGHYFEYYGQPTHTTLVESRQDAK